MSEPNPGHVWAMTTYGLENLGVPQVYRYRLVKRTRAGNAVVWDNGVQRTLKPTKYRTLFYSEAAMRDAWRLAITSAIDDARRRIDKLERAAKKPMRWVDWPSDPVAIGKLILE